MDYKLPKGFRWTGRAPDYLEFEHVASEKRGAVSHCERAVLPDADIQGAVNYNCAKLLSELASDQIWAECDRNHDAYTKRKMRGDVHNRFLALIEEANGR